MFNPLKKHVKAPLSEEVAPWDSDRTDRFARVTVTDNSLIGWGYDGKVVTLPIQKCIGETYDWDTHTEVPCPDHTGFCPGERRIA